MDNEGHQQRNNNEDELHGLLVPEDQVDTESTGKDDNDEDYVPKPEMPSKRLKRHTPEQIQELKAAYEQCHHPDDKTRRALGAKIGLEARQVQYWFQNQRTQMQAKALVQDSKTAQQENAALMAENVALRHAMLAKCCVTCGGETVPADLSLEKRRLLAENARLKHEYMRATAFLGKIILEARPTEPPVSSSIHPVLSIVDGRAGRATLLRHAEASMEQFLMLATQGEPLWVPTPDGEVLSYQVYQKKMFPVEHAVCPQGFVREATREAGMVRGTAADLVGILTNANRWSEMFPGVVAGVTAGDIVSGGIFTSRDRLIQLMNAELWVQSPRLRNRSMNFLRYSKLTADRRWAVMDVSVDGILEPEGSHKIDLNVDNAVVPAFHKGCRLLPSGCLVEDMGNGYCKVTWVVHAEYDETTVPTIFRPLHRSGKALGAHRWLASLQRQREFLAVLHSSHVPSSDNTAAATAISSVGRRGILELAQRMMSSFYSAVSGPVTQPSSSIDEWHGSTGSGDKRIDAAVRMVTWRKSGSMLVLSASTTVWLPNTPPRLVFEYLCNDQRRGEWDTLANGAAVKELGSIATGHLAGNAISVLCPNVTDGIRCKMLILQETCTDASCSMVVYAPVEEKSMLAVMNGGEHASVFLLPSGFAILPDGHGKARHAACTSSAPGGHGNTAGSLLTVACQALLLGSAPGNHAAGAFDDVGKLLRRAIKKIKVAVKAKIVVPSLV
ncbi:Homeobox-leucine zipper protein ANTHOCYANINLESS 2 [Dichanthelium oligosanthes]|uniref:Homeobox-leucine zipper protein ANTHOCYANINLESS 2 n=1 Tax=Dichanthelium oligosanthes TaxID=888268 RepID=A0A1E5WKZ3_9POAL|nr:Homeobox-leucine zipper protein ANTHOCYANINLESS 2 [Dichanthelium oligosanthes]